MASGTPASGGSGLPAARSASTRAAASSASRAHLQECLDPALARLDGSKGGLGHLGSGKVAGGNARGDLAAVRESSLAPLLALPLSQNGRHAEVAVARAAGVFQRNVERQVALGLA